MFFRMKAGKLDFTSVSHADTIEESEAITTFEAGVRTAILQAIGSSALKRQQVAELLCCGSDKLDEILDEDMVLSPADIARIAHVLGYEAKLTFVPHDEQDSGISAGHARSSTV